jgi:hypothetical protein
VPANRNPDVAEFLAALEAQAIESYDLTGDYFEAQNNSNFVTLEFTLSGAQESLEYYQRGRFHRFPLDKKTIEIPLALSLPAIINDIEISRPSDFVGDVSAEGLNASFIENNNKYQLDREKLKSLIALQAEQQVMLSANFHRTPWQIGWLFAFPLILAVAAGVTIGFVANIGDKDPIRVIVPLAAIVALPSLARNLLISEYEELPNFLVGQPFMVFDAVFIVGWILFAAATAITTVLSRKGSSPVKRS